MQPDQPESPDAYDAPLSVILSSVEDISVWLAIWLARTEPDAEARRCTSRAIDSIDAVLLEMHGIRARLVTETHQADQETAARADAMLAKTRDGPLGRRASPEDRHSRNSTLVRPSTSAAGNSTARRAQGPGTTREEAP